MDTDDRYQHIHERIDQLSAYPTWLPGVAIVVFLWLITLSGTVAVVLDRTSHLPPEDFVRLADERWDWASKELEKINAILLQIRDDVHMHRTLVPNDGG